MTFGSNLFTLFLVLHFVEKAEFSSIGLVLACRTAPIVFVSLWGGFIADRFSKNTVASIAIFGAGIANLFAAFLTTQNSDYTWIYLLSLLSGILSAFGAPSLYALLPFIASEENLFSSNALIRTFRNLGTLVSPGFYGAASLVIGAGIGYVAAATTILASLIIFSIRIPSAQGADRSMPAEKIRAVKQGIQIIRSYRKLFILIGFWACFLPLQAGLANAVQPAFIAEVFDRNTWVVMSFLLSAGYITGSLIATHLNLKTHLAEISVGFILLSAVQILAATVFTHQPVLFIFSFLAGVGLELSGVCWGTYLQKATPKEDLGKVSSLDYAVSFGLIPLGYLASGAAASLVGLHSALFYGSLIMIFMGIAMLVTLMISSRKP